MATDPMATKLLTQIWDLASMQILNIARYTPGDHRIGIPADAVPVKLDVDEEVSTLYYLVPVEL